jgi:SNF2 family DNA or RNA helicase
VGPRADRVADGRVKLHRAEAGALAAFADGTDRSGLAWAAGAERLIGLGQRLKGGVKVPSIAPPPTFMAVLRPYQGEGLSWLGFLREAGFGGVLADDMGLGKTVQALAFLAHEKAEGRLDKPALIVSPTSVLPNWQAEAERFAPELSVLPLRGLERRQMFDQIARADLVLTTYPLLARDHQVLLAQEFHVAILDEAQAIKNPKAGVSGLAHRLKARHRLALTGTPLENNLGEVWSLFEFLSPGLLGDESTFRRTFRTPIEKHGDRAAQAFLSRRLKPFMLRRTKEAVATELPPKTEIVEHVRLEGAQRDLYETVRALMHAKVREEIDRKGLARSHIVFLDALLKLRQICCDPRLLKLPQARRVRGSAKLERLMEMLPELIAEGRRVLLFSQFTSMLALIEEELRRLRIPYVQLTGDTADRAAPVRAFQAGKVPLFLLSLKAGGTGLNLTAADTVIHYDPWWNPAVEAQATDRAYRIGQDKPVFVYKLIVEEGIEAAIEQLKARKAALAAALFDGASKTPLDLSEADISALFAPLRSEPMRRAA